MRVFITGATGVLGQPTLRLLVARGHRVTALVRSEPRAELVRELGGQAVVGDLFNGGQVKEVAAGAEAILHLATSIPKKAAPGRSDWIMNDRIRREGTANLLAAARGQGLRSFVAQSVAFLYGDTRGAWMREDDPLPRKIPFNLRSAVDLEAAALEAYKKDDTPVVILRGALFYGPAAWSTRRMLDAIRHRAVPIVGSGQQYWHWIYVDDMARAVVLATEDPAPGEIFNVADDWPFHAADGLNYMAGELNAPAPLHMTPALARILGGYTAAFFAQSARYRTDKLKKMLGWAPKYPTYREGFGAILRQLGKRV